MCSAAFLITDVSLFLWSGSQVRGQGGILEMAAGFLVCSSWRTLLCEIQSIFTRCREAGFDCGKSATTIDDEEQTSQTQPVLRVYHKVPRTKRITIPVLADRPPLCLTLIVSYSTVSGNEERMDILVACVNGRSLDGELVVGPSPRARLCSSSCQRFEEVLSVRACFVAYACCVRAFPGPSNKSHV